MNYAIAGENAADIAPCGGAPTCESRKNGPAKAEP
jgi:hypothetical protein